MGVFQNNLMGAAAAAASASTDFYEYQIDKSLRLPLRTSGFSKTYSGSDGVGGDIQMIISQAYA